MTAIVKVVDQPWADQLAVYLITEVGGHRLIQRPNHVNGPAVLDAITAGNDPGPSLHLDYDTARALMDALARHFGQVTDSTGTRADYDAERARVDRLTTALIRAHDDQLTAERTRLHLLATEAERRNRTEP